MSDHDDGYRHANVYDESRPTKNDGSNGYDPQFYDDGYQYSRDDNSHHLQSLSKDDDDDGWCGESPAKESDLCRRVPDKSNCDDRNNDCDDYDMNDCDMNDDCDYDMSGCW